MIDLSQSERASNRPYKGRFAPSATGPMHIGTLVSALASWLDARQKNGKWVVRIEDVDTQRSSSQWGLSLLSSLQSHGLVWDGEVEWQSQRLERYSSQLAELKEHEAIFFCTCNRKSISEFGGCMKDCRTNKKIDKSSVGGWRLDTRQISAVTQPWETYSLSDLCCGETELPIPKDILLYRQDAPSYNFACSIDDALDGITHVIRGQDLLSSTGSQIAIFMARDFLAPQYGHHTLVMIDSDRKYSKQNHAPALDSAEASQNLLQAMHCLNLLTDVPIAGAPSYSLIELLERAQTQWQPTNILSQVQA